MTTVRLDEILWQVKQGLKYPQCVARVEISIPHLPQDEQELCINGNEGLLHIALHNLLENACKFSGDAPVKVELTLAADKAIYISFEDQGIGIPTAEQQRIFDPFYRATNTETVKGSGVGLSLVRHILQLHQATIIVKPNLPMGTIMQVQFQSV
jgi:signal transduction histidine kinase